MSNLVKVNTELFKVDSNSSIAALQKIEVTKDMGIAEVRKLGTPPISSLVKNEDKTECYKLLKSFISILNQFIGVNWNDGLLADTAKEMYSICFYWNQGDLKLFFKKAKMNEFGEKKLLSATQYSPMMFLQWVMEYDKEWVEHSVDLRMLEHDKTTYDSDQRMRIAEHDRLSAQKKRTDQDTINHLKNTVDNLRDKLKGE